METRPELSFAERLAELRERMSQYWIMYGKSSTTDRQMQLADQLGVNLVHRQMPPEALVADLYHHVAAKQAATPAKLLAHDETIDHN